MHRDGRDRSSLTATVDSNVSPARLRRIRRPTAHRTDRGPTALRRAKRARTPSWSKERFAVAKGGGQGLPLVRFRNDLTSVLDNAKRITEFSFTGSRRR